MYKCTLVPVMLDRFLIHENLRHLIRSSPTCTSTLTFTVSMMTSSANGANDFVSSLMDDRAEIFLSYNQSDLDRSTEIYFLDNTNDQMNQGYDAGVIGLEMGSVWSRLGAQVTFVEALPHILSNTDHGISQAMQKIMEKQGMKFHLKTSLVKAEVESPGQVKVTCQQGQENLFLEADKVLVAVGRRPFTKDLGLEALGIKTDRSFITVDHRWQTNVEGVYAIGDVVRGPMLAHKSSEEGVAVAERETHDKSLPTSMASGLDLPSCVHGRSCSS